MRLLTVVGLSEDGSSLLLRDGEDAFAVDLDEVKAAQRPVPEPAQDGPPPAPPSPREIQQRIRLLEVFNTPGNLEEVARTQLVDERLRQQELDRRGVGLAPEGLQRAIEDFAGRANLPAEEFIGMISSKDVLGDPLLMTQHFIGGTKWEKVSDDEVIGTHQLRVHAAHPLGLGAPIVGDRLYGHEGPRLLLHAEALTFTHPGTGERVTFTRPAPF